MIQLRLGLLDLALELADLLVGLADALGYRRILRDLRLGEHDLRLRLLQRGRRGIDVLLAGGLLAQAALAIVVGLRLGKVGFGVCQLRLRLLKLGGKVLARDLERQIAVRRIAPSPSSSAAAA